MREIIKCWVSNDYKSVHICLRQLYCIIRKIHELHSSIQIPARCMDSCAKYGSIDYAARSMDRADPQIAPNIFIQSFDINTRQHCAY